MWDGNKDPNVLTLSSPLNCFTRTISCAAVGTASKVLGWLEHHFLNWNSALVSSAIKSAWCVSASVTTSHPLSTPSCEKYCCCLGIFLPFLHHEFLQTCSNQKRFWCSPICYCREFVSLKLFTVFIAVLCSWDEPWFADTSQCLLWRQSGEYGILTLFRTVLVDL